MASLSRTSSLCSNRTPLWCKRFWLQFLWSPEVPASVCQGFHFFSHHTLLPNCVTEFFLLPLGFWSSSVPASRWLGKRAKVPRPFSEPHRHPPNPWEALSQAAGVAATLKLLQIEWDELLGVAGLEDTGKPWHSKELCPTRVGSLITNWEPVLPVSRLVQESGVGGGYTLW